jgi:predicted TIM-barrel fold metal-dependent hydrolase
MHATSPPLAHNQFVVRPEWLALRQEEIIEPQLPIVDAHHHFWNRDGKPYFLPELLADIDTGHNIVATVFMECKAMYRKDAEPALQPLGEVEFVNGIAAMSASGEFGPTRVAAGIGASAACVTFPYGIQCRKHAARRSRRRPMC